MAFPAEVAPINTTLSFASDFYHSRGNCSGWSTQGLYRTRTKKSGKHFLAMKVTLAAPLVIEEE